MTKTTKQPEKKPKKKKKKKEKTMEQAIGKLMASKVSKIRIRKRRSHRHSRKKVSRLSKILLRARIREKMLLNRKNDNKLTAQYRQLIRQRKMESIRQNLQHLAPLTKDLADVKHRIIDKTRTDINLEVQNTVNLIDDVHDNVSRINVVKNIDLDMMQPVEDANVAKEWIGRLFLLFKSFDFKEVGDMNKFLPEFEDAMQNRKKDDAKLEEIKMEEQRLLGQKKSLLMEIEDNEIRMIAKEQILKERIADQKKLISGLRRQIHDVQRRLGYLPSGFTSLMPTPLLTPVRSRSSSQRRRSSRVSVHSRQSIQSKKSARSKSQSNVPSRRQSSVQSKQGSPSHSRRPSQQVNDVEHDHASVHDRDRANDHDRRHGSDHDHRVQPEMNDGEPEAVLVEDPQRSEVSSRRSSHLSVPEN